jgi:putative colanic acid biosynthesis UDP-glucose lipid carrier transferase
MMLIRTRGLRWLFLLGQIATVSLLFCLWLPLAQVRWAGGELSLDKYALYLAALLLGVLIGYLTEPGKADFAFPDFRISTNNALWQAFYSCGCLFVYLVGTQDKTISRLFLFSFLPALYVALVVTQRYLPGLLIRASFSGPYEQRIALVGSVKKAVALRPWLNRKRAIGYRPIGILCDDPKPESLTGIKVLGGLADLESAIRQWGITQVILVEFPQFNEMLQHCTSVCEKRGVRLLVLCDFEERFRHAVTLFEDGDLRFVGLRQEPLEDPFNRFCKRALDLAVALPVAGLVLPVATAVVWALQRWQSPGPVFFRQLRSGMQNRPFSLFKFRTMHVENDDETRQARRDDPRLFPAGRWLRRFSVDELPQFLNVLRGEMSVVGPRPHLPRHDELFATAMNNYSVRSVVKPGITGLAQVRGFRGGTPTEQDITERVRSDIEYLENWSFLLDCSIILRTASQMVAPPKSAF